MNNQKGMALLLTLLITAVLTTVVIEYNYNANIDVDIAENYKNKMKAAYLAKSGIKFTKLYLESDIESFLGEEANEIEPILHGKPVPLGDGYITMDLEGEEGKININKLMVSYHVRDMFIRLLENLDLDYSIYSSLIDWLDRDDDIFEDGGAEDNYYQTLQDPYPCKNGQMDSMDELRLVKGVDDEVFRELKKYCTIFSTGLININEAQREVLLTLSEDITDYDVGRIIEGREEKKYENVTELVYLGDLYREILPAITTKSMHYRIASTGVVGDISYSITSYMQISGTNTKLLYSKEE